MVMVSMLIGIAQAKFPEFTYTNAYGYSFKQSPLLVLSIDTSTGYVVRPIISQESNQEMSDFARQVIGSFELVEEVTER